MLVFLLLFGDQYPGLCRTKYVLLHHDFFNAGTHYVDLWCGSPPQRQTVIVDTGSGVTAFPCSSCPDCGVPKYHIDRLFKEEESCSFHYAECNKEEGIPCTTHRGICHSDNNHCKISMSYAEGSRWDAYESIDKCYVGTFWSVSHAKVFNNKKK